MNGCPMCDGLPMRIGYLGNKIVLRCRHCGWVWTVERLEEEEE